MSEHKLITTMGTKIRKGTQWNPMCLFFYLVVISLPRRIFRPLVIGVIPRPILPGNQAIMG